MKNHPIQKDLPLLSVVIKAYNIEKELLDRCVSSVVQQTYTNLQILLINNRSKDDTGKYCDEWAPKDNRIKVLHKQKGAPGSIWRPLRTILSGQLPSRTRVKWRHTS